MFIPTDSANNVYVFYKSLAKHGNISEVGFKNLSTNITRKGTISSSEASEYIRSLAYGEYTKEIELLRQNFGIIPDKYTFGNLDSARMLTIDINYALNNGPIFKRVLNLLWNINDKGERTKKSQGRIDITQSVTGYIVDGIQEAINLNKDRFGNSIVAEQIDEGEIKNIFKEGIRIGIDYMANARARNNKTDKGRTVEDNAYKEILANSDTILEGFRSPGSLIEGIFRIFEIDKFLEDIKNESLNTSNKISVDELKNRVTNKLGEKSKVTAKGEVLELVASRIIENIGKIKGKDFVLKIIRGQGSTEKAKSDLIYTIGFDNKVAEELDLIISGEGTTTNKYLRQKHIQSFMKVTELLNKLNSGFIIMENAKNYQFGRGFKQGYGKNGLGGYSTGSDITAENFIGMNDVFEDSDAGNAMALIRALVNTMTGAVNEGDESAKKDITTTISSLVGQFLFDDFIEIGKGFESGRGNAIHLLNLSNAKVPLSTFLLLFSMAIQETEVSNPKDYVEVAFTLPDILFRGIEDTNAWGTIDRETKKQMWLDQQEDALKNTKIKMNFFKTADDFLRSLKI